MNKCPHCGYVNPNKVSICINCGKSLYSSSETEKKGAFGLYDEESILRERYYMKYDKNSKISYLNYLWELFLLVFIWGLVLIIPCLTGFAKYYILIYITVAFSIIFLWFEIMYLLLFNSTCGEFIFNKQVPYEYKWFITGVISLFPVFFSLILMWLFKMFF